MRYNNAMDRSGLSRRIGLRKHSVIRDDWPARSSWPLSGFECHLPPMDISPELARSLELRFKEYVDAERKRDVSALYEFIDPLIRSKREQEYEFEPRHTISNLREFTQCIRTVELESFSIDKFTDDGGDSRNHRPTAIVLSRIRYNESNLSEFRTPWILDQGTWYTCSLGKQPALDSCSND